MYEEINTQAIKNRVDIAQIIPYEFSGGGRYIRAREHNSLVIDTHNQSFYWNSRGVYGDVITWLTKVEGMSFEDALKHLGARKWQTKKSPQKEHKSPGVSLSTQGRLDAVAKRLNDLLFSDVGKKAKAWLNKRGLTDETLRLYRIGYNPRACDISGFWAHDGISIPHICLGQIWGIRFRVGHKTRTKSGQKYLWLKGSRADTIFGFDDIQDSKCVMVVEGEFDAMLVNQEIGLPAITLGSANYKIPFWSMFYLLPIKAFYLALDNDRAGDTAKNNWLETFGKRCDVLLLPDVKDVTDLWQSGKSLQEWFSNSISRVIF